MNYLISHYKGKYRLLCPYDLDTIQYPRTLDGKLEDIDVYISCHNNIKITYHGKSILKAYIPSIGRGNNIIKAIESYDSKIIQKIIKTDEEIVIYFHSKYMSDLEAILKPKTFGASIGPFSTKNLLRNRDYKIPDEEINLYKEITSNMPIQRVSSIQHTTNNFLDSISSKDNTIDMIKIDMRRKGLKAKEYIHSIGMWNKYIEYLKENL